MKSFEALKLSIAKSSLDFKIASFFTFSVYCQSFERVELNVFSTSELTKPVADSSKKLSKILFISGTTVSKREDTLG